MSLFNRGAALRSAVTSAVVTGTRPRGRTYEGAPAWMREPKGELFLAAVTTFAGADTFYESADARMERLAVLAAQVAVEDVDWLTRLVRWTRDEANLRSIAIVLAVEGVAGRLAVGAEGGNRQLVAAALRRADEPGELLAYWMSRHGRTLPKPVKRGVGDAVRELYDERALLKHDSAQAAVRFGDVLELTHPWPKAPWQGDLFAQAIGRRHDRAGDAPASLPVLQARARLMAVPTADRRQVLLDGADLRAAGMTWESVAGWLGGPLDKDVWERLVPTLGYMAALRNLRNLDEAGVSDDVAAALAARLADPAQVARSRQLPLRFLSAYREAPALRWAPALEKALQLSLANVPALPGRTLVLVDRSGSMFCPLSARSRVTRADAAALFGAALALRAEDATLVQFGTTYGVLQVPRAESLLRTIERFGDLGGTNTAAAVRGTYRGHDRVVIVTDEQAWAGWHGEDPTAAVPAKVPVYTWNVAGYAPGHAPSGRGNRHAFGGLTDAAFTAIGLLERGSSTDWPF